MTTTLNATTSNGLVVTPDNSGNVQFQYNGIAAPAFSIYLAGSQTLPGTNTFTKILFDTKEFDTANCVDVTTNKGRFTPTVAGYYQFNWNVEISTTYGFTLGGVYKNGSTAKQGSWFNGSSGASTGSCLIYANGTTDYFELFINFNGNGQTIGSSSAGCYFQGFLARSA